MGVYIKGMEMPKCCGDCPYRKKINPEENQCFLNGKIFDETFSILTERRHADCPLVPCEDMVEVKRGRWIDMGDFISCSKCNATRMKEFLSDYGVARRLDARTTYCPNCGAKMESE